MTGQADELKEINEKISLSTFDTARLGWLVPGLCHMEVTRGLS